MMYSPSLPGLRTLYKPRRRQLRPRDIPQTLEMLEKRRADMNRHNFNPKWINFAIDMVNEGYLVYLYENINQKSKYLTLNSNGVLFKIRFSDHLPIRYKYENGDCDFFVGKLYGGKFSSTEQCRIAVKEFYQGMEPRIRTLADVLDAQISN